jgi:predicted ArsR family transcriptional regulator
VVAAITNILKETRSVILSCLKTKGRMSVEEIASEVGVSKVSIRRHLELLRSDGLVEFEIERQDRGRPGHVYQLTSKAGMLFPTAYNTFALGLLKQVGAQFGERGVLRILGGQADEMIASLKKAVEGLTFDAKVKRLSALIDERGYAVILRRFKDGSYLLRQRNCPMVSVASGYSQICDEEIRIYREVLGTQVFRECRIAAGAQSCDYRILPPLYNLARATRREKRMEK